jgi:hypothetical protein
MTNDAEPICFKSIEFLRSPSNWLKLPLFTILFDDGTLLLATVSTHDADYVVNAGCNRRFLYHSMGISIISQLNEDFCDTADVVAAVWCPTTIISEEDGQRQFSMLLLLSKSMIRVLKISMIQPGESSTYAAYGLSIHLLEAIKTSDIELSMDNICSIGETAIFCIPSSTNIPPSYTLPVYLTTINGAIHRLDLVFTFVGSSISVRCNHGWMVENLFNTSFIMMQHSALEKSDSLILLSTGMSCGLVKHSNGQVIKFPETGNTSHFTSIASIPSAAIAMARSTGVHVAEEIIYLLTSSAEDTLSLWSFDEAANTVNLVHSFDADLEFIKPGLNREYFTSLSIDPHGLCVYIAVAVPPLQSTTRATQLNVNLQSTNTRIVVYPLAKLLKKFFPVTIEDELVRGHYEVIHHDHRNQFTELLKRLSLSAFISLADDKSLLRRWNSLSLSAIPIYLYVMVKHVEVLLPIDDDNLAKVLGVKSLGEIRQILADRQANETDTDADADASSSMEEPEPTLADDPDASDSSDSDTDREDEEAAAAASPPKKSRSKKKRKTKTTRRMFTNEADRKLAKSIRSDKKKAVGGNFRELITYFTLQSREHIYHVINAFFDAAYGIAAIINARQAGSPDIILPTNDVEAHEILFRLTVTTTGIVASLIYLRSVSLVDQ